jgi:hypothetical protein
MGGMLMKKLAILVSCLLLLALSGSLTIMAQVQVHGFVQARFLMPTGIDNRDTTKVQDGRYTYRIDRLGVRFTETINEEIDWITEVYVHPSEADARARLYLETANVNWHLKNKLPWDFNVRFGKGRNYTYGITPDYSVRRASDYSLYSEAFTQLRVLGIQTFSNFGKAQLAVGIINQYSNVSRDLPDMPVGGSVKIPICDRDTDQGTNKRIGLSGRLGYKNDKINVGLDTYLSDFKGDKNNEQYRYGADGQVKLGNLIGQVQGTIATTRGIDHMGAEVLVGWEDWTKTNLGFYARYGMLTYDVENDPKYYDVDQIQLSAMYKLNPRVHLRLEGLINGEDGIDEVDNDLLFFETVFVW